MSFGVAILANIYIIYLLTQEGIMEDYQPGKGGVLEGEGEGAEVGADKLAYTEVDLVRQLDQIEESRARAGVWVWGSNKYGIADPEEKATRVEVARAMKVCVCECRSVMDGQCWVLCRHNEAPQ